MVARCFVDTNVLLRATLEEFPSHDFAEKLLADQVETGAELWISRQIIREYIVQATRPQSFSQPLSVAQVKQQIMQMKGIFEIADDSEQTTDKLLELIETVAVGGKQIHDANIVATMLVYEVSTLITANVDDFQRFSKFVEVIPIQFN